MKKMKLSIGVFLVTLMFLSSVTIVGSIQANNVVEQLANENEDKNVDAKKLLFNTIIDILNDGELKSFLKDKFKLTTSQLDRFMSYDYNDIENRYQKGIKIYNTIDKNQIEKLMEKINKIIQMNTEYYAEISNIIHQNEKVISNIDKLKSYSDCVECQNYDGKDLDWIPGQILFCTVTLILILIFWIPAGIGTILITLIPPLFIFLGLTLMSPWLVCMYFYFYVFNCNPAET